MVSSFIYFPESRTDRLKPAKGGRPLILASPRKFSDLIVFPILHVIGSYLELPIPHSTVPTVIPKPT